MFHPLADGAHHHEAVQNRNTCEADEADRCRDGEVDAGHGKSEYAARKSERHGKKYGGGPYETTHNNIEKPQDTPQPKRHHDRKSIRGHLKDRKRDGEEKSATA